MVRCCLRPSDSPDPDYEASPSARDRSEVGCVADLLWSDGLKLVFREKHDVNALTDNHASRGVIGELSVKLKIQLSEKIR